MIFVVIFLLKSSKCNNLTQGIGRRIDDDIPVAVLLGEGVFEEVDACDAGPVVLDHLGHLLRTAQLVVGGDELLQLVTLTEGTDVAQVVVTHVHNAKSVLKIKKMFSSLVTIIRGKEWKIN